MTTPRRIIREQEVRDRTGLSRAQRWRRVRQGTFPIPIQLGPNSIGWYEDEIDAFIASLPRVRYAANTTAENVAAIRPHRQQK